MEKPILNSGNSQDTLSQINQVLRGQIKERKGEKLLDFKNNLGKGSIVEVDCLSGLKSLSFKVKFKEDTKICLDFIDLNTLQFVFVIKGKLRHCNYLDKNEESHELNRFQNIIITTESSSTNSFVFYKDIKTHVNIIFASKSLCFLDHKLYDTRGLENDVLFEHNDVSHKHFGNYSLKIGDLVTLYSNLDGTGLIKKLSAEGYISLIIANQLQEYWKHKNNQFLPDSLSNSDIIKIKMIAIYINENITEDLTITKLRQEVTISSKKMQLGFKVLFSESVNSYIRSKKLELAATLIKNTDLSISEIVYRIGYNSRSYFSRIFFKKYNILPNEYKAKFQNNISGLDSEI